MAKPELAQSLQTLHHTSHPISKLAAAADQGSDCALAEGSFSSHHPEKQIFRVNVLLLIPVSIWPWDSHPIPYHHSPPIIKLLGPFPAFH